MWHLRHKHLGTLDNDAAAANSRQKQLWYWLSVNLLPLQGVVGDVGERGPPGPDGKEVRTLLRLSCPLPVFPSALFCIWHHRTFCIPAFRSACCTGLLSSFRVPLPVAAGMSWVFSVQRMSRLKTTQVVKACQRNSCNMQKVSAQIRTDTPPNCS